MKILLLLLSFLFIGCAAVPKENNKVVINLERQRAQLVNISTNKIIKTTPISSSKYGEGSQKGSNKSPTGLFLIAKKIGENMPLWTGFRAQQPTKNINQNDPIVGRIWILEGLEPKNKTTKSRLLYCHGTKFVDKLGSKASLGCFRFSPESIAEFSKFISVGSILEVR